MSIKLYDYQITGKKFLVDKKRCILADTMGLGKTIQSIAAIKEIIGKNDYRVFVFCPAPIKIQWQKEFERQGLKATIVNSGKQRLNIYKTCPQIIIINYELFLKDKSLLGITNDSIVICDEASRLKNHNSKINKLISMHTKRVKYLWLLTGTPVENNLQNIYTLINLTRPYYMMWNEFLTFCNVEIMHFYKKTIKKIISYKNLDKFLLRISPLFLRRKAEGVNMPNITINNEFFEATTQQKKYMNELVWLVKNDTMKTKFNILTLLRGIDDSVEVLNTSKSEIVKQANFKNIVEKHNYKIERLQEILEETSEHKIIIFTQFANVAKIIRENLYHKYDVLIMTSETTHKEELLEMFRNRNLDRKMVLVCTDVLSYGINLEYINLLINFDLPWNPAILAQRIGRIRRINSESNHKHIINFIGSCLENHVFDIIIKKQKLFDDVVDGKAIKNIDIRRQLLEKINL